MTELKHCWADHIWLLAIIKADRGDHASLVDRLRSDTPLSNEARELVADLLSRHKLKRKQGGRSRPVYAPPSENQVNVLAAALAYHEEGRKPNECRADAAVRLAGEYGCHPRQLQDFLDQTGGTYRKYGRLR